MICTSQEQAQRVAETGAYHLITDGYTLERSAANRWVFKVHRPASKGGNFYWVQIAPGMRSDCPCPFFRANRRWRICKHIQAAIWEAEAQDYCQENHLAVPAVTAPELLVGNTSIAL